MSWLYIEYTYAFVLFSVSEWVRDCCLMTIQQFFSYIMARTSYIQRNDPDVDPRSTRPDSKKIKSLILFLNASCGEATNINCIVFSLTRPGLEPTIYHTRGNHANNYSTDAVSWFWTASVE